MYGEIPCLKFGIDTAITYVSMVSAIPNIEDTSRKWSHGRLPYMFLTALDMLDCHNETIPHYSYDKLCHWFAGLLDCWGLRLLLCRSRMAHTEWLLQNWSASLRSSKSVVQIPKWVSAHSFFDQMHFRSRELGSQTLLCWLTGGLKTA